MKKLLFVCAIFSGAAFGQSAAQCLQSGTWVPCSSIATVQEAQAVNVKASAGSGTTITNAFSGNTTAGNSILCLGLESAAAIPVFTDAQSNTYTVIKSSATAPGGTIAIANNIVGGTTDTITLTTTSGAAYFACHELKGPVLVGQAWDANDLQQATGTTITFVEANLTQPNEMVFAAAGFTTGQTVNATPTLGSASTNYVAVDSANTAVTGGAALAVAYAAHTTIPTSARFQSTMALSGSVVYTGLFVSVKPAVALPVIGPSSVLPSFQQATYAASKVGLATAASPTDIAVLSGNATNSVVPIYVSVSCTQTTAGIFDLRLLIRTTADSAGTSTGSPVSYAFDQNNIAAVSSVLTYTANPTVNDGTDRPIDSIKLGAMAPATAVPNDIYIWRPTMGQAVVLRGTAQQLAVNLNGVTLTGGSCDISYRWLELSGI